MNYNKLNNKSAMYLLTSSFVFMISGYLVNLWLGKELGAIQYGVYGVVISLMTTINIIQTSGLPQATTKFIASKKDNPEEVLKVSLYLQFISTLFLSSLYFSFSNNFAKILNDSSLINYIRLSSLILPTYALFSLYIAYYNGLHDFKKQSLIYIVYSVSKFLLIILFVYFWGIYGAILGFVISPIIALSFGFHWPKINISDNRLYKEIIILSFPLIGYAILSTLQISIDLLMIKSLSRMETYSGLYTAGQNLARIPFYALGAFSMMLFPIVTHSIHNESKSETGEKIRNILRNLYLLLFPGTILIALTSTPLLRILYSSEYIDAGPSLSLLVFGLSFFTVLNALTYVLVGADRPSAAMAISGLGVVITSVICYLAIPSMGLTGAALGTTVGAIVTTLLAFYMISRQFPKITPWISLFKISVASFVMYLVYLLIGSYFQSFLLLLLLYIILAIVYIMVLYLLKEITRNDIDTFKELFLKRHGNGEININTNV